MRRAAEVLRRDTGMTLEAFGPSDDDAAGDLSRLSLNTATTKALTLAVRRFTADPIATTAPPIPRGPAT